MEIPQNLIIEPKFQRFVDISYSLFNPVMHENRTFHTTFIVKGGKIKSIGINNNKTNTKNLKYPYRGYNGADLRDIVKGHSELLAVIRLGKEDLSDYIFINVRIGRNGLLANSCPCRGCKAILEQVGYRRVFYSTENGFVQY